MNLDLFDTAVFPVELPASNFRREHPYSRKAFLNFLKVQRTKLGNVERTAREILSQTDDRLMRSHIVPKSYLEIRDVED